MSRNRLAIAVSVVVALGLAFMARTPEAGPGWRVAFVAISLGSALVLFVVRRWWEPPAKTVLLGAVLMRLVLVPLPPSLSDDGYRYVWDGMAVVQEGMSPYQSRPSDLALSEHHNDEIYTRLNSPGYYSVYPPVSQAVFTLGGLAYPLGWEASWLVIKLLILSVELIGVWCLIRLVTPGHAMLYAWHPLAVVEVAGQGHTEGLLVGFVGLALLALRTGRTSALGWMTLAGWVKLYPFLLLPAMVRRVGMRGVVVGALVGGAGGILFLSPDALDHVRESLGLYVGTFDFYSAPYLALKAMLYPVLGEGAGRVAASVLTGAGIAGVLALVMVGDGTAASARRAVCWGLVAITLTSPTLHPWHWLGVLFVLPLLQTKNSILWIASLATATYLGYIHPPAFHIATWSGWGGGVFIALWAVREPFLAGVMHARALGKTRRLMPFLSDVRPGGRFLDLGAGEGYVGAEVASQLGLGMTGLDITRYGAADPRVELYDGRRVPFPSGHFDVTLLVLVLHHAADPVGLLREAVRVTSGPVVVLETVHTASRSKRSLERLDRWLNRLRSRGHIDEAPLDIRSDEAWREVFASEQMALIESTHWDGFHPQALYVLEGQGSSPRTSARVAERASSQIASS